jgi:hypothetical protein
MKCDRIKLNNGILRNNAPGIVNIIQAYFNSITLTSLPAKMVYRTLTGKLMFPFKNILKYILL